MSKSTIHLFLETVWKLSSLFEERNAELSKCLSLF